MFKENLSLLAFILPALIITYYASNMLNESYEEKMILHERIRNLENQNTSLEDLDNLEYSIRISYKVTVTTYNPTEHQTDSTPNITADGTKFHTWKASSYRYVALSRDLLSRWGGPFNYGDYIVIEGTGDRDGVYQVRDTMNPKWTNRVDILTTNDRFKYNNITMYKYVNEDEYLLTHNN